VVHYPGLVRRMVEEGHAVGNHTFSHRPCRELNGRALAEEVGRTDELIRSVCPEIGIPVFRPPFGSIRPGQALEMARQGRRVALWSCDSRDYRRTDPAEIARLGQTVRPRDIVLLHDRFNATVEGLEGLLNGLARRALGTVTLDAPDERPGGHV
jgi:peptidoglycan-N-acetylglucosamine deacetylase